MLMEVSNDESTTSIYDESFEEEHNEAIFEEEMIGWEVIANCTTREVKLDKAHKESTFNTHLESTLNMIHNMTQEFTPYKAQEEEAQDMTLDARYEDTQPKLESKILTSKKSTPWLVDDNPFVIPCKIGSFEIDKALCDSGASVNLMPLLVCNKLGRITLEDTQCMVQFTDKSMKEPEGVLHNVLVQIQYVLVLETFIMIEVEEDTEIPIVLGRPFLDMTEASLHMKGRVVHIKVGDKTIIFDVNKLLGATSNKLSCKRSDEPT